MQDRGFSAQEDTRCSALALASLSIRQRVCHQRVFCGVGKNLISSSELAFLRAQAMYQHLTPFMKHYDAQSKVLRRLINVKF